jgi:hypothetical protein
MLGGLLQRPIRAWREMNRTRLADKIAKVRSQIEATMVGLPLDHQETSASAFVCARLHQMERECRTGELKPAEDRYPELSRMAVESDWTFLPPALGGQLIEVEEK